MAATFLFLVGCVHSSMVMNSPNPFVAAPDKNHIVHARNGIVVSVSSPASEVGASVLKKGGNAVDAAVATAFALAVAYPPAGNLGGGGFMMVHPAPGRGEPVCFDYRECAPAAAYATMYTPKESQFSRRAVAVPGTVRGFALAHKKYGKLPWAQLLSPAIALAKQGFILDTNLAESMNITLALAPDFEEFQKVFAKPGGGKWQVGDRLVQPDLAQTLQLLADKGPDVFYTGVIAREIIEEMKRGDGIITREDLESYRALERKPLTLRYRGLYDVFVPPPPSAGGTCLLEELSMLENFDLSKWGKGSAKTIHVMAESMRRANYDRARYLGDPAFVPGVPELTTLDHGRKLANSISMEKATRSEELSTEIKISHEGDSTTQFSIIDREGMAVANTYTLERRWGSRIVVKNRGFLLNNDMRAFNIFPGKTFTNGTIGTASNIIAPGKRPLSSQTPTIVSVRGKVKIVTGSPGSQSIPHTVLCILVSLIDFHTPVEEAVSSPRFSHQWFPDQITMEATEKQQETVEELKRMGHTMVRMEPVAQGDAHTIWVDEGGEATGVADWRINGKAAAIK
ncbi:MAG: ggt [Verrucomicrobiales bacterium]|nr:ggt [Verrucomicrobiales bacterium]